MKFACNILFVALFINIAEAGIFGRNENLETVERIKRQC
uniref:Uncharacterized protein n=1 Tax=Acrobeloides nanus TaxID=290746 RepID=A0A914CWG7_9BILA